ncbi:MAG: GH3 auxin-responsive promoter family protein [Bacteroidota bacterium]|nr:GH3 auxin-responsive promoter family protein [Bacteroidota bacterium]
MGLLNKIISLFSTGRLKEIDYFKSKPEAVQEKMFKYLLKEGQYTVFGKDYNFSDFNFQYDAFKQNVPVSNYEQLKPYIEKVIKGEKNVLWNTPIKWMAKSSGTTDSRSKYIPVSKQSLEDCHFRGGKDVISIHYREHPKSDFLSGKGLAIGGSREENKKTTDQKYYGDVSAVIINNLPIWANLKKTPDKATALMPEWEEKLEKMAQLSINENVTSLSGVPSWTLVLMKKVLEITGKSNLIEVWPNLELFTHGGVNFSPYRKEFRRLIPSPKMKYREVYNASEGFFAMQDDLTRDDMLLMLDYGVFYEFIPVAQADNRFPDSININDVELEKNYAMVISTNGGLWRYLIGDTVKFTSKYPHRIKITGRTKHFINAFGEELIVDNTEKAIEAASGKTNAVIKDYTVAPIYMDKDNTGAHEWIIEFEKKPKNIEEFRVYLDDTLKEINSDYDAKRYRNYNLTMPIIHVAKENLFYSWLKSKNKLGGQNKVPRLSNNRDYIEDLLNLNQQL